MFFILFMSPATTTLFCSWQCHKRQICRARCVQNPAITTGRARHREEEGPKVNRRNTESKLTRILCKMWSIFSICSCVRGLLLVNINKMTYSGFILTFLCKCLGFFHNMVALFKMVLIKHFLYMEKIIPFLIKISINKCNIYLHVVKFCRCIVFQ